MKAPPFDYARPASLSEALSLLATDEARPIAGGQSLMPLLALRMSAPRLLVDISDIAELKGVECGADYVRLGALTRWCDILKHPKLSDCQPLLVEAIGHVGHYQIRNRGTVGGSCAHADPAAEMPAIAVTCDAELEIVSDRGIRVAQASDFFAGILTTTLEADELLMAIRLPRWPAGRAHGFQEFARRSGDFAIAGCAAFWEDVDGRCGNAHVGVFGVGETPFRVSAVEAVLNGHEITPRLVAGAVSVLQRTVSPQSDVHASGAYRSALLAVLMERALLSRSSRPRAARR